MPKKVLDEVHSGIRKTVQDCIGRDERDGSGQNSNRTYLLFYVLSSSLCFNYKIKSGLFSFSHETLIKLLT